MYHAAYMQTVEVSYIDRKYQDYDYVKGSRVLNEKLNTIWDVK